MGKHASTSCRTVAGLTVIIACELVFPHVGWTADGPEITTTDNVLPHGIVGTIYNYGLERKGGQDPISWKQNNNERKLPAGLNLNDKTGSIYGIPTQATPQKSVEITVEDSGTKKQTRDFAITVFADKATRNAAINSECFTDVGEKFPAGDLSANISVGPTVTTQLIRYNLATERASLNAKGLGIGAAFRFYNSNDMDAAPGSSVKDIRRIRTSCRATTFSAFDGDTSKIKASSWLSLSPVIFASVEEVQGSAASEVSVQPALMVGFLRDLINVGVGWNLAGPNRGQVFLLMGIGTGFRF